MLRYLMPMRTSQKVLVLALTAWSDGAQAAISRKRRSVASITRFIDVNLTLPLPYVANRLVEYGDRPWEIEAYSIVDASGC